ncbi:3-oxoacyl-[acyl-carrier-protein] synthase III C-terminal domain-containing protein [Agrobacterium leguminum]
MWDIEDVDVVIAHQANKRILDAIARELSIDPEKLFAPRPCRKHSRCFDTTCNGPIKTRFPRQVKFFSPHMELEQLGEA